MLTRLAALGPARSARPGPDGTAPADRVRPLLQHLADVAADAEQRPRRPVPVLAAHAVGDQLLVLVADVRSAVRGTGGTGGAGTDGAGGPVLEDVAVRLTAVRRRL